MFDESHREESLARVRSVSGINQAAAAALIRTSQSSSLSVKLVSTAGKCENDVMCNDAKLSPQPLCDHACTAAAISLAATVNVSDFKKGVINVFSINIGISGLLEI